MEPTTLDIKRQGDLGGTKVAMGFDENSLAHIMSVLTDLYSDPALAIIREYSTNAWDAHVEAGVDRPIEITTPNQMSPYFKVKDFGVGLSVNDISDIYSKYGASTKRGTNEQVGMLGLGCKSALTFTQQFTLIGIKNGVKATVSISRVEDGTGVMEIVDTRATDEPNGVEVIIPVRHDYSFIAKVEKFFRFWSPGSVLVNGQPPNFIKGTKVTDNLMFIREDQDYIVMGNVAYPVKDKGLFKRDYYANFGVVAFVDIGDINFTPSREALHYTNNTLATIERIKKEFGAGLTATMTKDIASAATHSEAIEKYLSWEDTLGKNLPANVTYKGEVIPTEFRMDDDFFYKYDHRQQRNNTRKVTRTSYRELRNVLLIVDFDAAELTSAQKKKARLYLEAKGLSKNCIIFAQHNFCAPWVDALAVSWDEVKKVAQVKKKSSDNMPFKVWNSGYWSEVEELDEDATIIFFGPRETEFQKWGLVQQLDPDAIILRHGLNRHEKLKREFSGAVHYRTYLTQKMQDALDALTEDDKINLNIDEWNKSTYRVFNPSRIDDPEIVAFLASVKAGYTSDTLKRFLAMRAIFSAMYWSAPKVEAKGNPLLRYPLIDGNLNSSNMEHVYCYMNACYQMEQEKEYNA